jgi:hypothetical protein
MPQQGMTDLSRLRKRPLETDAATRTLHQVERERDGFEGSVFDRLGARPDHAVAQAPLQRTQAFAIRGDKAGSLSGAAKKFPVRMRRELARKKLISCPYRELNQAIREIFYLVRESLYPSKPDRGHQASVRFRPGALSRAQKEHASPVRDLRARQSVYGAPASIALLWGVICRTWPATLQTLEMLPQKPHCHSHTVAGCCNFNGSIQPAAPCSDLP